MNKFFISAILTSCFITQTFSLSIQKKLTEQSLLPIYQEKDIRNESTYSNFSGVWDGACTQEGEVEQTSLTIQHSNINTITIDGVAYSIGHRIEESLSNNWILSSTISSLAWNSEKTKLNMKDMYWAALREVEPVEDEFFAGSLLRATWSIKDNELSIKGKIIFLKDSNIEKTAALNCIFHKTNSSQS